jgi:predicted Zn finger-like uncharacterized protein
MIVTCPSCSSKYRVRNEAVPADGARMRCPKCDTLFLAKPPSGGEAAAQPMHDDPSSLYQQLNPATHSGVTARPNAATTTGPQAMPQPTSSPFGAPATAAPPPGVGKPQTGPITALFQSFDPAALPAEAQRPPARTPTPAPAATPASPSPSGLALDNMPKVRLTAPANNANATVTSPTSTRPSAKVPASLRAPPAASLGATIGSWVAVGAGALVAAFGIVFWAWTTETANLDGALMPMFEQSFGKKPPHSTMKHPEEVDELRNAATAAETAGDLPRAVVLWRRVQSLAPDDPRGAQHVAKNLTDLGETEATP